MLEEALELAQACGCSGKDAQRLAAYVFARPGGGIYEKVGGVIVTVAALCGAIDVDMAAPAEVGLDRNWTRIDDIRLRPRASLAARPCAIRERVRPAPAPFAIGAPLIIFHHYKAVRALALEGAVAAERWRRPPPHGSTRCRPR
jgi:hypothetical protein